MPPIPADPNLARRKIYFHKAFARDGDPEFTLDRAALMGSIRALSGTAEFHLDEGDEQYLCAVGDQDALEQSRRHRQP